MKANRTIATVVATVFATLGVVSSVSAQYGSGACAPSCDLPAPTCEAPSCDVPSCEPSCDVGCGGYSGSYCGAGYCGGYGEGCCLDLGGVLAGALNAAISPFRWIYCEFTDGVFPDCGCAPYPEKTPCNPCNSCGDYVGGCNDNCETYPGSYCPQSQGAYVDSYPAGPYSAAVYDSEQYDASPTRGGRPVPALPINGSSRGGFAMRKVRNFNVQEFVGNVPSQSGVRSVGYERSEGESNKIRPVQAQAPVQKSAATKQSPKNNVPQVRRNAQVQRPLTIRQAKELQNKSNVRIVSERPESDRASATKTFGQTRPIQ